MLTVRPATPDDAAGVAGVHVRAEAGYEGFSRTVTWTTCDRRTGSPAIRWARRTPTSHRPGCRIDSVIVGFVTTGAVSGPGGDRMGEVLALHVDPGSWGLGIGRRLISDARAALLTTASRRPCSGSGRQRPRRALLFGDGWRPDGSRRSREVWAYVHRRNPYKPHAAAESARGRVAPVPSEARSGSNRYIPSTSATCQFTGASGAARRATGTGRGINEASPHLTDRRQPDSRERPRARPRTARQVRDTLRDVPAGHVPAALDQTIVARCFPDSHRALRRRLLHVGPSRFPRDQHDHGADLRQALGPLTGGGRCCCWDHALPDPRALSV